MSTFLPDQILAIAPAELAQQPGDALFEIKNSAALRLTDAKTLAAHVDRALDLKYADRACAFRLSAGKDTGVVHFDDGAVRITADLPKKVDWDQKQLAAIHQRIAASGDNPAEFIETIFHVSETKFNAWNQSLKDAFIPARTVKTGKPDFRLALTKPGYVGEVA